MKVRNVKKEKRIIFDFGYDIFEPAHEFMILCAWTIGVFSVGP